MKYKNCTIQKRKNCNTWWTRIRINGQQYTISGKTQKECYQNLKNFYNETVKPKVIQSYTLKQWKKEWIETYKKDSKQTTLIQFKYLDKHTASIENIKLKNIKAIQILKILNEINAQRQKQKLYEYLKDIFDKAYKNKLIEENPLTLIEKPKYKKITQSKSLSLEQEREFIKACTSHNNGDFYLVMLYQGFRKGECLGLKMNDIDFSNNTIRIDESINDDTKETTTKNTQSIRICPMFERTKKILLKYKDLNKEQRLFTLSKKSQYKYYKEILENASLPHFKIHELRHTFITRCQEQNIPEFIIQSWVGHEIGSVVTKKVYTHTTESSIKKNFDIMNSYFDNQN